jgi:hypothetical protein
MNICHVVLSSRPRGFSRAASDGRHVSLRRFYLREGPGDFFQYPNRIFPERTSMMTTRLMLCAFSCILLLSCSGDKAKELIETAEFEERQMNLPHAKQLYEDVIRLYPTSKEAEKAQARLAALKQAP